MKLDTMVGMYIAFTVALTIIFRISKDEEAQAWPEVFERDSTMIGQEMYMDLLRVHGLVHQTAFAVLSLIWIPPIMYVADGLSFVLTTILG